MSTYKLSPQANNLQTAVISVETQDLIANVDILSIAPTDVTTGNLQTDATGISFSTGTASQNSTITYLGAGTGGGIGGIRFAANGNTTFIGPAFLNDVSLIYSGNPINVIDTPRVDGYAQIFIGSKTTGGRISISPTLTTTSTLRKQTNVLMAHGPINTSPATFAANNCPYKVTNWSTEIDEIGLTSIFESNFISSWRNDLGRTIVLDVCYQVGFRETEAGERWVGLCKNAVLNVGSQVLSGIIVSKGMQVNHADPTILSGTGIVIMAPGDIISLWVVSTNGGNDSLFLNPNQGGLAQRYACRIQMAEIA